MRHLATLLLTALPLAAQGEVHGRGDRLVVPARPPGTSAPQEPQAVRSGRDEAFQQRILELRRSLHLADVTEGALLQRLGQDFDAVGERAARLLRTSNADVAYACARALELYGEPRHAEELEFLLLTRRYGDATDVLVETMARLARGEARARLFSCLTADQSVVRRAAAEALADRVGPDDAEPLITLSRDARVDVQLKALRLLGRVPPSPEVRQRLLDALGQDPGTAAAAVEAWIDLGPGAAGDLQEVLRHAATGRSFGYAALALVGMEVDDPRVELLTADMREPLLAELDMPDPFQRTAVALALAGLAWRSSASDPKVWHDREVVQALIEIVDPRGFVDHYATVERLARRRLALLTGQDFGPRLKLWREWWGRVSQLPHFAAARREVAVDAALAESAFLTWRGETFEVLMRGPAAAPAEAMDGRLEIVLAPDELVGLVDSLRRSGFMREAAGGQRDDEEPRVLILNVGGVLARTDPQLPAATFDRFAALIGQTLERNRWQLYRDPLGEPDPTAFWRAETRWLERHADDARALDGRLKDRIAARLPELTGERRTLALRHLAALPRLAELLTTEDGLRLADAVSRSAGWDESCIRILELALLAPGDAVWQRLLEVAAARDAADPDAGAVARVFALADPDRLLAAVSEGAEAVRRTAIEEVAQVQDLRATPVLLGVVRDEAEPVGLRRSAAFALGRLRAPDALEPLIGLLDAGGEDLDAELRRTIWVALGRIGGDRVFEVLRKAFPSPDPADRRAIVQSLGQMRDPRAANELAAIFVLRGEDTLGQLSREFLRRMGDALATPALRPHLEHPSEQVRQRIALLAGEFQDAAALPELMSMMAVDGERLRVATLIAGITGLDLLAATDRDRALRDWWRANRDRTQARWFLDGLAASEVANTLKPEDLAPGQGVAAVPELCRLVMECGQPHLRALAGKMLRVVTGEDFGTIMSASTDAQRAAIVERYRFLYDSSQSAERR